MSDQPNTTNEPDLELIRLLGRYAEAYFSKTGEDMPKTLTDIEALLSKREIESREQTLQKLLDDREFDYYSSMSFEHQIELELERLNSKRGK